MDAKKGKTKTPKNVTFKDIEGSENTRTLRPNQAGKTVVETIQAEDYVLYAKHDWEIEKSNELEALKKKHKLLPEEKSLLKAEQNARKASSVVGDEKRIEKFNKSYEKFLEKAKKDPKKMASKKISLKDLILGKRPSNDGTKQVKL